MPKKIFALAAVVVLAAACGSAAAARHSRHSRQARGGVAVALHKTKLGKVLATSTGRTLYLYTPDGRNKSNCYGSCASLWPPLLTKGKPRAGKGLKKQLLGETMRKDGKHQVTYAGHPLYRFSGDAGAGQVKGEGYAGIWYVLNSSGKKVAQKQKTSTGGGYGSGGY
jgi:predicted lipoprotein with Yx(FWY)xxD motif